MYLVTYRTGHRLIDVLVFRGIFGDKALNAVSGVGADEADSKLDRRSFIVRDANGQARLFRG
jgi:hypothetical protein